jgi:hypothetical protein
LAFILANEVNRDYMFPHFAMLKGFARDLKSYMNMCNTDAQSPTKGQMRQIPLSFSAADIHGDPGDKILAEYLFCGGNNISIDIFGLNVERWCDPTQGPIQYHGINKWVSDSKFPGAFIFTEMGAPNTCGKYGGARDWGQVPGFFQNFPGIDGFAAYCYFDGQPGFSMFESGSSTAQIKQDGTNFFKQMSNVGTGATDGPSAPSTPVCTSSMLGVPMDSVDSVLPLETGPTGYPAQCPKPYKAISRSLLV